MTNNILKYISFAICFCLFTTEGISFSSERGSQAVKTTNALGLLKSVYCGGNPEVTRGPTTMETANKACADLKGECNFMQLGEDELSGKPALQNSQRALKERCLAAQKECKTLAQDIETKCNPQDFKDIADKISTILKEDHELPRSE